MIASPAQDRLAQQRAVAVAGAALFDLLDPCPQLLALRGQPFTPFSQFGELNDFGLIGVKQAGFLPLQIPPDLVVKNSSH